MAAIDPVSPVFNKVTMSFFGHQLQFPEAQSLRALPEDSEGSVHFRKRVYTVADPTYIGSEVGQVMPQHRGITPEIIAVPDRMSESIG